mgnify:CR=1 FL=1
MFLYEYSALVEEPERMRQAFKDTILVVGNTFHYEGTLNRKPFLVSLSCSKGRQFRYNTSFVIEPGDIQLRIVDWEVRGMFPVLLLIMIIMRTLSNVKSK